MQAAKDRVVSIDYTLKDADDQVIDTSEGREPLAYIHGNGQIIPGLERALEGKGPGEDVAVTITPEEGYGERDDSMVMQIPREQFEGADQIEPGMQFQAETDEGVRILTVLETGDQEVTVDGNHPLAGVTLNFNVNVVDVRDASQEELDHGHVHGPGGHDH
ncbi:FKBP-type peptidyl-prolyl cis-trans isomerase [Thiohalorhabdus sp. Cl-TMA]|uniref:Peptidyl-prolyl cis-trans isomerase n=1 Tax=Thiohalorhabdus methylotrophus TaxID=3242694 RepID=A0ABV4TSU1_9GAMM